MEVFLVRPSVRPCPRGRGKQRDLAESLRPKTSNSSFRNKRPSIRTINLTTAACVAPWWHEEVQMFSVFVFDWNHVLWIRADRSSMRVCYAPILMVRNLGRDPIKLVGIHYMLRSFRLVDPAY